MTKYFSLSYGPLTEDGLASLEKDTGRLPGSYRSLLLHENGGVACLKDGTGDYVFHGIYDGPNDLRQKWEESFRRHGHGFLAIASSRSDEELVLNLRSGAVSISGRIVASSAGEFLERHCQPVPALDPFVDCIDNRKTGDLAELLARDPLGSSRRVGRDFTLPQYAVIVRNEEALHLLARHGYDFGGAFHLLLRLGGPRCP